MPTLMLEAFQDNALSSDDLLARLAWLRDVIVPRLDRFLGYYRNPTTDLAAGLPCLPTASFTMRPFRQYQEIGLPARITGFRRAADGGGQAVGLMDGSRREVVIENDLAWRVNTLVDFSAGRMPSITSTARDPAVRERLTRLIERILQLGDEGALTPRGGLALLQQLVLHGSISGSAWIHLRPTAQLLARLTTHAATPVEKMGGDGTGTGAATPDLDIATKTSQADTRADSPQDVARWMALEVIEAARLCPLPQDMNEDDRPAYAALITATANAQVPRSEGLLDRVRSWFVRPSPAGSATAEEFSFDLFGARHWQRYVRGVLTAEGENPLGFVPFIRYENDSDPAAGTRVGPFGSGAIDVGMGDVEPLIGLQDELNTRLSDRAFRVTMTCFRMYLGRGIEDFTQRPIGPGQMWATDNPAATIESFGGDATMPSEESHINEVREALDKISGVSPVSAGLIRGKLGNLTSAVALRLTLIALLARTERKRAALTATLAQTVRLALEVLDRAGIFSSDPRDRGIDVNWPTPLPESDMDRLQEAQVKLTLGVPREVVLTELGYGELSLKGASAPAPAGSGTELT